MGWVGLFGGGFMVRHLLEFNVATYIHGDLEHAHVDGSAKFVGKLLAADRVGYSETNLYQVYIKGHVKDGMTSTCKALACGLAATKVGTADFDGVVKAFQSDRKGRAVFQLDAEAKLCGGGKRIDAWWRDANHGYFGQLGDGDLARKCKRELDHAKNGDLDTESDGKIVANKAFVLEEGHQSFGKAFELDVERNRDGAGGIGCDGHTFVAAPAKKGVAVDIKFVGKCRKSDAYSVGVGEIEVKVRADTFEGYVTKAHPNVFHLGLLVSGVEQARKRFTPEKWHGDGHDQKEPNHLMHLLK